LKSGDTITGALSRVVGENVGTFAIGLGDVTAGGNYAINFVPANLTITAKTLTITAAAQTKVYDSVDPALTYAQSGLKLGDTITGDLARVVGEDVGTFEIKQGNVTAGGNYAINFVPANLTITAKTLTITAAAQTKVYDSVDPALTYSTIGLKSGDTITGALSRVVGEDVGTFAIGLGGVTAGGNYAINFVPANLTITAKPIAVTVDAQTKVYDSVDPALTYSTIGLKSGDSLSGALTRDPGENVGTFAIRAGNLGNTNYSITFNSANLTITAKTLTITAAAKTKVYDSADPALTYTPSGLKLGDTITGDLVRVVGENVGAYAIGLGGVTAGGNYAINFVPANLTITEKTLTIIAEAKTKVYDSVDPALTYTQSGLKLGDRITGDLARVVGEDVGTFEIKQGNVTAGSNYSIAFKSANLTITAKPMTVVVSTDIFLLIGSTIQKSATYLSKGTLTWSASPAENCTISESGIVKAVSAGFCTVTARVSANGNYLAGSDSTVFLILPINS
jgi:hypothetical protein